MAHHVHNKWFTSCISGHFGRKQLSPNTLHRNPSIVDSVTSVSGSVTPERPEFPKSSPAPGGTMKAAHHLGLSLLLFILQIVSFASTPSSGNINTPADNSLGVKQTITYFGGPFAVSTGFSNLSLPA